MHEKLKEDCSIFRDLYESYNNNEVEEETFNWMNQHEQCCINCKKWITNSNKDLNYTSKDEKNIKKAKFIMFSGLAIVSLLAIWTSIWIFI